MLSKIITIISNFNLVLYSSSSLVIATETEESINDISHAPKDQSSQQLVSQTGSAAEPPVVSQGEPPVVSQTEPPVVSQGEPPVVSQGEPPAVSQTEPPAVSQTEPPAGSGNDDKEKEKMKKNKKAGDIIGKITTQPEFLKAEGDKELTSLNGEKIPKGETWVEFAFTFNGDYEDKYDLSTISFNKMGKKEDKYDALSISMLLETNNPLITSKTNDKKTKIISYKKIKEEILTIICNEENGFFIDFSAIKKSTTPSTEEKDKKEEDPSKVDFRTNCFNYSVKEKKFNKISNKKVINNFFQDNIPFYKTNIFRIISVSVVILILIGAFFAFSGSKSSDELE